VKAGKIIRRDSYGFERFSDYWTSPGEISGVSYSAGSLKE